MKITTAAKGATQLVRGLLKTRTWGVRIEHGVKLAGPGTYALHKGSVIRNRVRIYVGPGATLTLHPGASIGSQAIVNVTSGLSIGRGTRVSWRCQITDSDFHAVKREDGTIRKMSAPVVIGDDVLVSTGSIILKGVEIGHDSVVGAGSVVSGRAPIPPHSLVAGNPAEVRQTIGGWVP